MRRRGKEGRKPCGGQRALHSSKDSTPESQVMDASFSCRLLMISWSSELEPLWRHRQEQERGGGQGGNGGRGERGEATGEETNIWLDVDSKQEVEDVSTERLCR